VVTFYQEKLASAGYVNAFMNTPHSPDTLFVEIESRLRAQHKWLGKIFALMFPALFNCRNAHELTRDWDKNVPSCILTALPKYSWLKRLRRLGLVVLISIWHYIAEKSPAIRNL
jgi:hypothetical protein